MECVISFPSPSINRYRTLGFRTLRVSVMNSPPRERAAGVGVPRPFEHPGRLGVPDDPAGAGASWASVRWTTGMLWRFAMSAASLRGERQGGFAERVVPLRQILGGPAADLDLDAVVVRAGGGPRDVELVHARHDRVVVGAVVGARPVRRASVPGWRRSGRRSRRCRPSPRLRRCG